MFSFGSLLLRHGYSLLFVYVLAVGIGLPLPADPLFLLMGALAGNGQYSFSASLLIAVIATLIGDILWYQLGRFRGRWVLGFLCKLSLEPDTCVRKTEARFVKRGAGALVFAKFIPGMGLLSVSLAGISRIRCWLFLVADAVGCTLWAGSYLLLGRIFHRQVDFLIAWLGLFGRRAGFVIVALLALYIAVKFLERKRLLRNLRVNRITPQQAFDLIENGQPVTFVDLRHPAEVERDGFKIAGALVLRPDDLRAGSQQIPKDREIILYCT
ncbi:MAG: VTT domain-containing protein [Acidobacteriaceae bacterium]|nr:VTT domain-containing protein [Acidobacteriaceae bacterium]MBV9498602.1 VTT domain-containing protein [Acidobacteriaceae bacterium]